MKTYTVLTKDKTVTRDMALYMGMQRVHEFDIKAFDEEEAKAKAKELLKRHYALLEEDIEILSVTLK